MSLVVPKKSPISTNCRIWTPRSMCLHSLWWQNNFFYDILLDTSFSVPTSPSSSEDTAWVHMHVGTRSFSYFVFSCIERFRTHAWIQNESLVIFATCHRVVSFLPNTDDEGAANKRCSTCVVCKVPLHKYNWFFLFLMPLLPGREIPEGAHCVGHALSSVIISICIFMLKQELAARPRSAAGMYVTNTQAHHVDSKAT